MYFIKFSCSICAERPNAQPQHIAQRYLKIALQNAIIKAFANVLY